MSSAAQQAANLANAQNSTGPKSPEGKSRAAQNAVKLGLFSKRDFVPDESREAYDELRQSLLEQLAPANPLESALANEIVSAAWRLERIAQNEANSGADPDRPAALPFERARTAASCILFRTINELRKIQTDRIVRVNTVRADVDAEMGLAETAAVHRAVRTARAAGIYAEPTNIESAQPAMINESPARQNEPFPQPEIPRNAPCPCGSGAKFKRCCGVHSAPLLHKQAA